jgi:hypothetical protein
MPVASSAHARLPAGRRSRARRCGTLSSQARSYDGEVRLRISSFNSVIASAALFANIVSCGEAFSRLEGQEADAGRDGAAGTPMTGGAGARGGSGGHTVGGSGGSAGSGRAGADAGASAGKGGSGGGSGATGSGGSAGSGGSSGRGGAGGSSGRGGSSGSVDAGGSSGQTDASRRDAEDVADASGRDAADASAGSGGTGGSDRSDARADISEGGMDAGSSETGGSDRSDVQTDTSDGGVDAGMTPCSSWPPTDCAFCCTMRYPEGVREYQQRMYSCACVDCYPQCGDSLCNSNAADPSVPCLTCIRQRIDSANCAPGRVSCAGNPVCSEYMSCADACFPGPAQ